MFHGFRKIFNFLIENLHFLSTEFPVSEHRILGSLFRAQLRFWVLNLHFLNTEFWAVYLEQLLSALPALLVLHGTVTRQVFCSSAMKPFPQIYNYDVLLHFFHCWEIECGSSFGSNGWIPPRSMSPWDPWVVGGYQWGCHQISTITTTVDIVQVFSCIEY